MYQSEAGQWLNDAIMTGWGFAKGGAKRVGEGLAGAGITFARLTQNLQKPQHRIPGLEPLGKGDVEAIKQEAKFYGRTLANVRETGPAALDAITELGPERSGGVVGATAVDVVGTAEGSTSLVRGGARALRAAPGELAEVGGNLSGMFASRGGAEAAIALESGSLGPGSLIAPLPRVAGGSQGALAPGTSPGSLSAGEPVQLDLFERTQVSPRTTIHANKAAGDAARDVIAAREAPSLTEVPIDVMGGRRIVDVLKTGDELTSIESKVGRTSLGPSGSRVRQELARDWWSKRRAEGLPGGATKVDRVIWEFTRSDVTGRVGPTADLAAKLQKLGFDIVINK